MDPCDRKLIAKSVSVAKYLATLGSVPTRSTGSYDYYLSPLPGRNESHPSFLVRKKDGKWNDRGKDNDWDDVLSLVMKIENCNFQEAIDKLLNIDGITEPSKKKHFQRF